jgi:hypothetical protein
MKISGVLPWQRHTGLQYIGHFVLGALFLICHPLMYPIGPLAAVFSIKDP